MGVVIPQILCRLTHLLVQHTSFLSHAVVLSLQSPRDNNLGARGSCKQDWFSAHVTNKSLCTSRTHVLSMPVPLMYVLLFW